MSYRLLKFLTVLIPTLIIGGFEFIRHEFLLHSFSMEAGNWLITIFTVVISYLFSVWMFGTIERKNKQLAEEKSRGAVYEERERMARELHDNIGQVLFFLNVKIKQGKYDEAKAAISEMDNHLRQAIFNLRSSPDEGISFTDRLTKWLDEWNVISGIDVFREIEIPEKRFTTGEEVQIFAIIQEAFTNIRKHSEANCVNLTFHASSTGWTLEIIDDGIGLANQELKATKYGLSMMEKRANELNAIFELNTDADKGITLRITSGSRG